MGATRGAAERHCYFCDQVGQISKEHAWPQWMQAEADVLPTRVSMRSGYSRTSADTFTVAPNIRREQQGSALKVQVREVCEPCNNGWMSRLETQARPVLERLWSGAPIKLTSAEVATLARWAVKTAWMHERARDPDPTANIEQRQSVMFGMQPGLTRVWLGRYVGEHDFNAPILRADLGHQKHAWNSSETARAMMAMLIFHGVVLMVRTDSRSGVPRLRADERVWLPLAPRTTRGRLSYPPRPQTDDDIRRRLMDHRDWAEVPDVPHFQRDTRGWLERPPREPAANRA